MTLSEAIRLGAMLHPQVFGQGQRESDGVVVATCALAAAYQAGYRTSVDSPLIANTLPCPACGAVNGFAYAQEPTSAVVVHLNDQHHWTREAIADWVATVEPPEAGEAERQPALTVTTDAGRGTTEHGQPVPVQRA